MQYIHGTKYMSTVDTYESIKYRYFTLCFLIGSISLYYIPSYSEEIRCMSWRVEVMYIEILFRKNVNYPCPMDHRDGL